MGSEKLLYIYGFVCLCMIAFNIIYDGIMRGSEQRLRLSAAKCYRAISLMRRDIRNGKNVSELHIKRMAQKLSKTNGLMAFEIALEKHYIIGGEALSRYLDALSPVFIRLAHVYAKRDSLQTAYFAYCIGNPGLRVHIPADEIQKELLEYLEKDSLYCRVNTMRAIYGFGNPKTVTDAVVICDKHDAFLHDKILQDGLLTFAGDHDELIGMLWKRFDKFHEETQVAILNYIRFKTGNYKKEMLYIMRNEKLGKELRLAAIRYFGKYPDESAKDALMAFADDADPVNWEYAAISANALGSYEGDDIVDALIDAALSRNWHVRYNASSSLKKLGVGYSELADAVEHDRYASEMLKYRLDEKEDSLAVAAV